VGDPSLKGRVGATVTGARHSWGGGGVMKAAPMVGKISEKGANKRKKKLGYAQKKTGETPRKQKLPPGEVGAKGGKTGVIT